MCMILRCSFWVLWSAYVLALCFYKRVVVIVDCLYVCPCRVVNRALRFVGLCVLTFEFGWVVSVQTGWFCILRDLVVLSCDLFLQMLVAIHTVF